MDYDALHLFIQKGGRSETSNKVLKILSKNYYRIPLDAEYVPNFIILGVNDKCESSSSMDITIFFENFYSISTAELWKGNAVIILNREEAEEVLGEFFPLVEIKEPFCI